MKLLVLDGNSILNRAYYGIKLLTTKDGYYTNGIYGFLTMFQKIKDMAQPDAVAIAFDMRKPTFRHKAYAGYKAQRKGMPEELAQQFPVLKELLVLLGYTLVECEGYEADDILGTFAAECERTNNECIIATGDKDSLQLVSPNVNVRLTVTKMGKPEVTLFDEAEIKEVYGVEPKQLIDIKAIQGDTSDNIPGVKGIGQKGALDLIQRFHDLDYIYENIETIDVKASARQKLIDDKDNAYLSRSLGEICKIVPINTDLSLYKPSAGDKQAALKLMTKLEFFSLIEKMNLRTNELPLLQEAEEIPAVKTSFVTDSGELLEKIKAEKKAVFISDFAKGKIERIAFALENEVAIYKDVQAEFLKQLFEDEKIAKQTHNIKPVFAVLDALKINAKGELFDTVLAAYLLNPSASGYDVKRLADEYSANGVRADSDDETAALAVLLPKLAEKINLKIKTNNQTNLLQNIEIPLAKVLAEMENEGFAVDANGIEQYGNKIEIRIKEIETEIYSAVGYEFNINSPKQLGVALFEKLGLPPMKKTKSGYSTGAEVLEKLKGSHPSITMILEYRKLAKLKSTYCDGLLKVIEADGRIRTSFNQTETRTGRISSTEPNLQNIPVRTQLGKELRRFFIARDGYVLVDADYSQIELRVLAHIANDKAMLQAFKDNDDIHAITASQVFNMPLNMVTPVMRSRAKAVNFGIVYGIGAFSLAGDIGVTRKEADNYIKAYLQHYAGVDNYMKSVVEEATQNGFVETMYGRRRYLPELAATNHNLRSFGERVARNMPIQGTAADIIKIAMIKVAKRLKDENMKSKLILQVHDELIVEAPQDEALRVAMILQEEMEQAVTLNVPLVAEASVGKTWYDAKG
ncbi:DNA polymerase [Clostridia bacterium]|nr:DNA polymerase [Clostridia bacterium]